MAMQEYPTQNIHLPSHRASIRNTLLFSLTGGIVLIFAVVLLLADIIMQLGFFEKTIQNIPTVIALSISAAVIFLYKTNDKFQLLGVLLIFIAIITFASESAPGSVLSPLSLGNVSSGITFFIVGLSLIASILKIPHRYHFMQLTVFVAFCINLFASLKSMYQVIDSGGAILATDHSLISAALLLILCQSIMFIKPDRGFIGLFTTDSRSSQLARMSLTYFITLPLVLGFLLLLGDKVTSLDQYQRLAVLVLMVIVISIAITWANVRSLYTSEVEHFLMREALRVNNISLEMHATDLTSQVSELEEAKKSVTDKFNNQQTLTDIMDAD